MTFTGDSGRAKVYEKPQILTHTYIKHYYYCLNVWSICM